MYFSENGGLENSKLDTLLREIEALPIDEKAKLIATLVSGELVDVCRILDGLSKTDSVLQQINQLDPAELAFIGNAIAQRIERQ
jgi:predicted HAD superfamily phosphohydrolase